MSRGERCCSEEFPNEVAANAIEEMVRLLFKVRKSVEYIMQPLKSYALTVGIKPCKEMYEVKQKQTASRVRLTNERKANIGHLD